MERKRDYAYEALAEVTASDPSVARGELNAALRDIRISEPSLADLDDSYLLSAEIHERAKMYRALWPEVSLTPTALSKHWVRVKEERPKRTGANLSADTELPSLPVSRREQNLEEARKLLAMLDE
jgi:tRNA threonylcarbamoyladenosine modification (KEOPS) complex  Pcc1 subunit